MGKRKGRTEISETLISSRGGRGGDNETVSGEEKRRFFACYLLTSLSPRHKGHTYIGFTVNPRRRIRQHNGEIRSGAWRTKTKRPWEMVFCIYGFPSNVSALQFEWAWQHPTESLAVRKAAATFKSLSGLANKIKLGHTMLTLPAWQNLHLTVNFFSTKYTKHSAGCPNLPEHMRFQVCSMDELPCYTGIDHNIDEDEDDGGDDEMCNNICTAYGSKSEGLTDITLDSQRDHCESIEETTLNQNGWIEDIGMKQSGDLSSSTEDHWHELDQPTGKELLTIRAANGSKSEGLTDMTLDSQSYHCESIEETTRNQNGWIEDIGMKQSGDLSSSTEDHRHELDQPTGKELLTIRAANNDQPSVNNPIAPPEVEVIDLLSPSPGFRISSSSRKRKVSYVCPEIIDLTKSPIFV